MHDYPVLKALYERLLARGNANKGAVVAAMCKGLAVLNAIAKPGQRWDESLHSA
jgi:hypothetical protein